MRNILSSINEACHFWANDVQASGRGNNVFFADSRIYSYGHHFCMARKTADTFVLTTRSYSSSTSGHIATLRGAMHGRAIVYCNDPAESASGNRESTNRKINNAFIGAEKKGIRKATIEKHKGEALRLAIEFNSYLEALPKIERNAKPIDTEKLDQFRAILEREEKKKIKKREADLKIKALEELQYLTNWRSDVTMYTQGMRNNPAALRLNGDIVETSHGANIPVSDALRLWPIIQRCRAGNKEYTPGMPLGNYRLNQIKSDGSIVVGCHNIDYSEIALMSIALGVV